MARSVKKRITGKKPKSRKSQLKFQKRMLANEEAFRKLQEN